MFVVEWWLQANYHRVRQNTKFLKWSWNTIYQPRTDPIENKWNCFFTNQFLFSSNRFRKKIFCAVIENWSKINDTVTRTSMLILVLKSTKPVPYYYLKAEIKILVKQFTIIIFFFKNQELDKLKKPHKNKLYIFIRKI